MGWVFQDWCLKRESDSWKMYQSYLSIVSSRVSAPPWNVLLTTFYQAPPPPPPPPQKKTNKLNLSDLPFLSNSPQNFGELNSPLKMYRRPKKQHSFFKETKDFISKIKQEHNWMLKYEYTVAKSKNQRRLWRLLSILFLLGS